MFARPLQLRLGIVKNHLARRSYSKIESSNNPLAGVEAESAQRQAFGIEAHIARSNVCLPLYYGPSVVKDHLLEWLPSENSKV
jgi:hypothetical protein